MTQIEQIRAEIERLKAETFNKINHDKNRSMVTDFANSQRIAICEQLLHFIDSLPSEQLSEDLEKAATALTNEIVGELNVGDYTDHSGHNAHWHSFKDGVVAGANWQKEQMMKSAIDAVIVNDEMSGCVVDCEQGCLVLEPHRYPIGQKLKILILEDEQ